MIIEILKASATGPISFRIFSVILIILILVWGVWGTKITKEKEQISSQKQERFQKEAKQDRQEKHSQQLSEIKKQTQLKEKRQIESDTQTALIYQTEISHFLNKFKTCLNWTLPVGNHIDTEIDTVFNYGINFAKGIDMDNLSKQIIVKIFSKYDFAKPMAGYSGNANFQPTGFNNLLGILEYLDKQLEKHLNKYGSSTSSDLTQRIEYMQRVVQSNVSSIRMDMHSTGNASEQTINGIADLMVKLRDDFLLMKSGYTKNVSGGYPIVAGKVLKSHDTEGSIMVETQFSEY